MWLTRIWNVALATAVAGLTALALVAPRPAARELTRANKQQLDQLQHNADLLLRLEIRSLIDRVSSFGNDPTLLRLLEQTGDRAADASQQPRVHERLLALAGRLPADERPEVLAAVDARGKIVSYTGPNERVYKAGVHGLVGFPVVEAALRGYELDDSWSVDNRLYLVAAAPVISRSQSRYVGALILGQQMDTAFANRMKSRLGNADVNVAFFLRGSRIAATFDAKALATLPRHYDKLLDQVKQHGRTSAVSFRDGGKRFAAVLAPVRGEASAHDAFYAVIGPPPAVGPGLGAAIDHLHGETDMKGFPWLMVIGIFIGVAAAGIVLLFMESNRPFGALLDDLRRVHQGDAKRLDAGRYAGTLRHVATAMNDLIDKAGRRGATGQTATVGGGRPGAEGIALDGARDAPAGVAPPLVGGPRFSSGLDAAEEMPPLASDAAKPLRSLGREFPTGDDIDSLPALPEQSALPSAVLPELHPPDDLGLAADPEDSPTMLDEPRRSFDLPALAPLGDELPPMPPPLARDDSDFVDASAPTALQSAPPLKPLDVFNEPTASNPFGPPPDPADEPSSLKVRVSASSLSHTPAPELLEPEAAETVMSSVSQSMAQEDDESDEESTFKQIYTEFVAVKKQCGEATDNVTYDRFTAKLRKNRDTLIERYGCRDVKFQVYVKDGKAALKATPVKD